MQESNLDKAIVSELKSIAGDQYVLTSAEDRLCYSYDGQHVECLPDGVVRPVDAEQVSRILRLANDAQFPVVPRGAGTGLTGGSIPASGGVVLDLSRMCRILEIDEGNLSATVEPGVVTAALAAAAEKLGLMFAPDPGSMKVSTIGGNVAENAGGLRAVKYGVTRDHLMQVRAVTPTGELICSGAKTHKCVVGYDLASLLCGSEGTLAVFTEITARLLPLPAHRKTVTATFAAPSAAGSAVSGIMASRVVPATLEIMDNLTLRLVEDYAGLGLPLDAGAMLLVEFDGQSESAVAEESEKCIKILGGSGAIEVRAAVEADDRARFWEARRTALSALSRAKPTTLLEDVTVPLPKISRMIEAVERVSRGNSLTIATFGHAGDGNLHPTILADERDGSEWSRVQTAVGELLEAALELGGTLSGEHGVGLSKSAFLPREVGQESVEVMRRIKRAFDPNNILNPGKFL